MFPPKAFAKNFRELCSDVVTLARLQAELFKADWHQGSRNLRGPIALCAVALVLMLGSVPILILGCAQALQAVSGIPSYLCLELSALGALLAAAALAAYGWQRINRAAVPFQRSSEELRRNVQWFKETLGRDWKSPRSAEMNESVEEH